MAAGAIGVSAWSRRREPDPLICPPEQAALLASYFATLRTHRSAEQIAATQAGVPVTGSMTTLRPVCLGLHVGAVTSIGDTAVVIGGAVTSIGDTLDRGRGVVGWSSPALEASSWNGTERRTFGRLAVPRYGPVTATVLADGRVLVSGGFDAGTVNALGELELGSRAGSHGSVEWSPAGSLSTPRWLYTATLLGDGASVLIAGGDSENFTVLSSVELWQGGKVTAAAPLHTPRLAHTATLLTDGRVLVVGGSHDGEALSAVEIYDPATGTTRDSAPLHTPRRNHTATLLADGRVLVVGGTTSHLAAGSAGTEIFDPRTGAWTPGGSLAFNRFAHTAIRLRDGRVLVAGGESFDCIAPEECMPHNLEALELWDPESEHWSLAGWFPSSGPLGMTELSSGQVMLVGPEDTRDELVSAMWTSGHAAAAR